VRENKERERARARVALRAQPAGGGDRGGVRAAADEHPVITPAALIQSPRRTLN
jgi:hypothetical protein